MDSVIHAEIGIENPQIFDKIDKLLQGKPLDLIIGGPPCQAYSVVGRASLKHRKNDERTQLYIQYGRFLNRYKPKAFIFENVPGILTSNDGVYFKNLQSYYKRLGYHVTARTLNSSSHGVIQNRKRVIIFGFLKSLNWEADFPEVKSETLNYNRDDIFSDLPKIGNDESSRVQHYTSPPSQYLIDSKIRDSDEFITQHVTRPHNSRDLAIYKLAIQMFKQGKRMKHNDVPEHMRTQKNTSSFLDRFKVVGELPHTVIAHIAKDGHHFIHPDLNQLRSISVREAARIQSFPDDFYFEGVNELAYRSAAFKQIGNAVPPLLSKRLAAKVWELFQCQTS